MRKMPMSRALAGSTEWISELMVGQADRVGQAVYGAMERHVAAVRAGDRAYFGGLRSGLETSIVMLETLQVVHKDHPDAQYIASDLTAYKVALS